MTDIMTNTGNDAIRKPLSQREADVLVRIARGLRVSDVAQELGLAESTVASYIKSIYRKRHISSRAEAALEAVSLKLV
jgi:DNA-binding NarL/FixJ family response regulator